jgi:hypothetical protein
LRSTPRRTIWPGSRPRPRATQGASGCPGRATASHGAQGDSAPPGLVRLLGR